MNDAKEFINSQQKEIEQLKSKHYEQLQVSTVLLEEKNKLKEQLDKVDDWQEVKTIIENK